MLEFENPNLLGDTQTQNNPQHQNQEPKKEMSIENIKKLAAYEMIDLNSKLRRNSQIALVALFICVLAGMLSVIASLVVGFISAGFFLLQSYSYTTRINQLSQKYSIVVKPSMLENITKNMQNNMQTRQQDDTF